MVSDDVTVRWSDECQVNLKSQTEFGSGGREPCFLKIRPNDLLWRISA